MENPKNEYRRMVIGDRSGEYIILMNELIKK